MKVKQTSNKVHNGMQKLVAVCCTCLEKIDQLINGSIGLVQKIHKVLKFLTIS